MILRNIGSNLGLTKINLIILQEYHYRHNKFQKKKTYTILFKKVSLFVDKVRTIFVLKNHKAAYYPADANLSERDSTTRTQIFEFRSIPSELEHEHRLIYFQTQNTRTYLLRCCIRSKVRSIIKTVILMRNLIKRTFCTFHFLYVSKDTWLQRGARHKKLTKVFRVA